MAALSGPILVRLGDNRERTTLVREKKKKEENEAFAAIDRNPRFNIDSLAKIPEMDRQTIKSPTKKRPTMHDCAVAAEARRG